MVEGPVIAPSPLAATTPDPLNMNTPDFTHTPSTAPSTTIATPNTALHLPQSSAARPAKKRKSWGQALPEPKTNLPPRKRAKTADEKEQRRIERIKRNRAAAHNSRERKRQEAERLEVENHRLKERIALLNQQLAHKVATLDKCKILLPGGLPELTEDEMASIPQPEEESFVSSPDSYDTIDPRASLAPSSIDVDDIKNEPMSPAVLMTAPNMKGNKTQFLLDPTQHSAAMLCDLQCRSSKNPSLSSWSQSTTMLWLMHLNIMTLYKSILVALRTLWPTRMERMVRQASTLTAFSTSPTRITSRRTRRLPLAMTINSSLPHTLTSTTLSLLMVSLSLRLPALRTLAQSILATGPEVKVVSARQTALPSRRDMFEQRIGLMRAVKAAKRQVSANGNQGRSGRNGGTLGKSSSEERKDEGGIG